MTALAMLVAGRAAAEVPLPPPRPSHNLYGMTGLIDMPSAEMQPDGQLSITAGYFGGFLRTTLSAQILPGIEAAFRYSVLDDLLPEGKTLYDRSFDVKLRLIEEGPARPALVLGLQDFLGTGVFSGEYLAATKTLFGGDLKVTGGIGWGRFAGDHAISNPLCFDRNRFCTRERAEGTGGEVNFGNFFSGEDMGFFGGLEWRTPLAGVTFKAEFSDDPYAREKRDAGFDPDIPFNLGLEYRPWQGVELGTYYMYGTDFGLRLTLSANPFWPAALSDNEPAPRPVTSRDRPDKEAERSLFGRLRELLSRRAPAVPFAESEVRDVRILTDADGLRWAEAELPDSAGDTCPEEEALAIDAEYGVLDAVRFRHGDGRPVCTVVLRPAARAAVRRVLRAATSYPTDWHGDPAQRREIVERLAAELDPERIGLFGIELEPERVAVYIENRRFREMPRAIGRTARALSATMPPSVELLEIIPVEGGVPVVSVLIRRSDLEELVDRPDAARLMRAAAEVRDAPPPDWRRVEGALDHFPRVSWTVAPHVPVNLFDPDQPVRADLSLVAEAGVELLPGLGVNAAVGKRLVGQLDEITRESDSKLPHVRSDIGRYLREGDPAITRLTADYVTKLDDALYGRLSAGLLERMYGGVSAELLWKEATRDWGLGLEVNWVKQRDFDQLFGFRDYDVLTGHASLYWDTGYRGLAVQVDAGRYLAKDWGATFTLKRRFANGWEIGGFFTLTDVPFEEFGEGSFDKGIFLTIPFNWFLPFESRSEFSTVIRPLTRDGGQRLEVSNRLYPLVEDMDRGGLRADWGGFWK